MLSNILEHHGRANQCLASLEEEKLKATIEALERKKSKMNAKVALMERKDLYKLLKAMMEGFQIANHLGTIGDDFSVDKFFGLQDPTSPDDVQAGPDFEEDLTTNERLRLLVESRNLTAKPQRLTRSTRIHLEYEPTILSDVPPTDNPTLPVTLDLTVDACKHPSSPPPSQIVPVPTFVDLTQYASSLEN
ncbi:hypothetical protein R1flu_013426 [Riccia fluitans]|uniref:Uncharacterized protein n=1 Tax=Riccia fluitans TaxID=41844 RepID=A0ABD1YDK3_9MARC